MTNLHIMYNSFILNVAQDKNNFTEKFKRRKIKLTKNNSSYVRDAFILI